MIRVWLAIAGLGGLGALIATYVVLLMVLTTGATALAGEVKRFAIAFTAVSGLPMSAGLPAIMQSSPP
jgi:hypothetical protein